MYIRHTTVKNPSGLHARPATVFVKLAASFQSEISILNRSAPAAPANAKSITGLLMAHIRQGQEIELCAQGPDEVEAVDALKALIDRGFGEL